MFLTANERTALVRIEPKFRNSSGELMYVGM